MTEVTFCEHPAPLTNFSAQAYMGIWYEQVHREGTRFEPDSSTCIQANYFDLDVESGHFTV